MPCVSDQIHHQHACSVYDIGAQDLDLGYSPIAQVLPGSKHDIFGIAYIVQIVSESEVP